MEGWVQWPIVFDRGLALRLWLLSYSTWSLLLKEIHLVACYRQGMNIKTACQQLKNANDREHFTGQRGRKRLGLVPMEASHQTY